MASACSRWTGPNATSSGLAVRCDSAEDNFRRDADDGEEMAVAPEPDSP